MSISIEKVSYNGWANNLKLANDNLELIVTLDVGPRILSLAPRSDGNTGENVFCVFPDEVGASNESKWVSRGGHRFWLAPENEDTYPFTYHPDNAPVQYEELGEGRARFRPPVESTGVQKEIEIELHGDEARVTVTHRVTNTTSETLAPLAPWALSVMAAGGIAVVPQPPTGVHPRDLLPNRAFIIWAYSDLVDPRLHLGRDFITIAQDATRGPIKIGLAHPVSWAAYWRDGVLFAKKWAYQDGQEYPDKGSTCELFSNQSMLEVESLGPLVSLAPGQTAEHTEEWRLFTDVPAFDARHDDQIHTALQNVTSQL